MQLLEDRTENLLESSDFGSVEEELDLSHPSLEGCSSLLMPHRLQTARVCATGEGLRVPYAR